MIKKAFIVCAVLFGLNSCVSLQLSVDDAYHWDDKSVSTTSSPSSSSNSSSSKVSTNSTTEKPVTTIVIPAESKIISISSDGQDNPTPNSTTKATLEYIQVQDTTITVRIKR